MRTKEEIITEIERLQAMSHEQEYEVVYWGHYVDRLRRILAVVAHDDADEWAVPDKKRVFARKRDRID